MKKVLNKIILKLCILILISSCHTFEHQNIFIETARKEFQPSMIKKQQSNKIDLKKIKDKKKKVIESDMAPISAPKKTKKVKKTALAKKFDTPKFKKFNLNSILNWTEDELIKIIGKGNFIKQEGILKNYQYYFSKCFLDVFLLQKEKIYFINHVQIRPTKLNGVVNKEKCLEEIEQKLN
ncbi:hypothetical protein OAK51_00460 [Alphaproteobacteria bacterium]|nr:hypothetical protein [Alphaproteobacteria bacterium]